jgi:hypothetical protein
MYRILPHLCSVSLAGACAACVRGEAEQPARPPSPRERRLAIAQEHPAEALRHAAQFNPSGGGRTSLRNGPRGTCWEPQQNPTVEHARQSELHRQQADAERAAAGPPPSPEEMACGGFPLAARAESPLNRLQILRPGVTVRQPGGRNGAGRQAMKNTRIGSGC